MAQLSEEALTIQMRLMKKYAVEKELNMTHTFQVGWARFEPLSAARVSPPPLSAPRI